jgi:hypothetical protein
MEVSVLAFSVFIFTSKTILEYFETMNTIRFTVQVFIMMFVID